MTDSRLESVLLSQKRGIWRDLVVVAVLIAGVVGVLSALPGDTAGSPARVERMQPVHNTQADEYVKRYDPQGA